MTAGGTPAYENLALQELLQELLRTYMANLGMDWNSLFSCPWRPMADGRLKSGIRRGFPQLTFAADGS
jgi:hypothetical protein